MIKTTHEISSEDGYIKYNFFEIHEDLQGIIADDYYTYKTDEFKKEAYCELMYKKNFYDKYDRDTYKEVYEKYIDNEKFKEKALFIYSIIDYDKYVQFVEENPTIENPNELTISYSILDSVGVKVNIYNIGISDISFVF
ncbi:hypothetical protein GCM10012288_16660 [Malaciobacter pacificus]|uniref:Uncharacterized protein n=1 Tax=Malaciobacter pacificus TaxID=1080223 RepID=A0A5C2HBJ6_9BACT|nr:hypothetical protein [Malaciobacter pacificus]QEP34154.1 hypothetical protein APAC_1027 [Malaciobacter pacificus]GGD43031.1 hypothetical protein GCM10012288_16660 [Malaciobacter pacificus]